ncbi:MAG: hypothetical protein H7A45_00255, partial [Verrucomicrobiales bacterium]|nr:hypothetical protein [Verrucomicrobiales bacterium]
MVEARVNTRSFESALSEFIRLKKLTLRDGLRQQAGLLADELIRDTPPTKGKVGGKSYGARKAGEARMGRDVRRSARPLIPSQWRTPRFATLIRRKKYDALEAAFAHFSEDKILPFSSDIHQGAREDGRVKARLAQATPDYREEAAYIRKMRSRVGLAKGGWAASSRALGRRVPAWLVPHLWAGAFQDHTTDRNPSVVLINRSAWAGGRHADFIVRKALRR